MIAGDTDLDALFKRLHLANARRVWRQLVGRAERESWAYRDFLALLATEEIFTTDKSLKAWRRVLHDEDLAQAIIDRVLERGRLLRLDGSSVRTLHVNLDER